MPDVKAHPQQAVDKARKIRDWGMARIKEKGISSAERLQAQTLEDCKAVNALLAAKATPQEASEYRQWALSG